MVRQRLLGRLRERFTMPVTAVLAPAGFGKTTLLAQAATESSFEALGTDCWLTCGADDAAESSLVEGLCLVMGISVPTGDPRAAADAVVEAMWHRSPREVVLVLDDVHEVPLGSPGAEVLARLVSMLPRNGHVVLSGRAPLPVPLARLEAQGHVLRLEEADLAFTDDELAELAARRNVPRARLSGCGGWPALVELAASATPGVAADYLWEEVLARLEPDRRRDLALLAHVGEFDDELADVALGYQADLASLASDLPLIATTSSGGRHIHALWRPHLAKAVSQDQVAEARRRVGLHLATAGNVARAVRLLAEAAAWDDVTTVVVDALGADRPPVPGDLVATWLGHLPDDLMDGPLAQLLGAIDDVPVEPPAAAQRLADAADAFRHNGSQAGELASLAQLAQVAWWSERHELLVRVGARLFEMEAAGYDRASPLASLARALLADMSNDSAVALVELDRIAAGSVNDAWQSLVDWLRSTSLNHLGRPAEALQAAMSACSNAGPLHAPIIETARMQARWFQGHVDEVLGEVPTLVERTAATGLRNYTAVMAASCCALLAHVGRLQDALPHLERARHVAGSSAIPLVDVNLAIAEATVRLASGDEPGAATALHHHLDRGPGLDAGLAAFPQRRTLALWYVLVPESRDVWEGIALGPCFAMARDLARSLVAVRAGGQLPTGSAPTPGPDLVRALLPSPWAIELALAQIAAGRHSGWALLDALWPQAQSDVRHHAASSAAPLSRPARAALSRLPVPPPGRLELRLLGPIELLRDGLPVDGPEWSRERVRSLLAHLVVHRTVSRERLARDLWPILDTDAQARNLRVTLTYLLRALEPERYDRDASFLIRPHGASLTLHRGAWLGTDIWTFDDLWHQATQADRDAAPSAALGAMRQAVALWRDDPSELASDDWATPEVEQRRIRLVRLAVRAGELLLTHGEPDEACRMGKTALRADPWSEPAHQMVIAAHIAAGDNRTAQHALQSYRDSLAELGIDPADGTHTLEKLARRLHGPAALA